MRDEELKKEFLASLKPRTRSKGQQSIKARDERLIDFIHSWLNERSHDVDKATQQACDCSFSNIGFDEKSQSSTWNTVVTFAGVTRTFTAVITDSAVEFIFDGTPYRVSGNRKDAAWKGAACQALAHAIET